MNLCVHCTLCYLQFQIKVSIASPNESETTTNDYEQVSGHAETSNNNTHLLLDLPVSTLFSIRLHHCITNFQFQTRVNISPPNECSLYYETATNDSEQVSVQEISDDNTQLAPLLDLCVSIR